jgi:cytochrome c oxidase subunit 3/cytochrome o ubiquinol oxidase subunit 3
MSTASSIPFSDSIEPQWKLPYRGTVGMACLIIAESAIFIIFVVAYVYYIGKSLSGPTPAQVLEVPIFGTVCLLSSSITIHFAESALRKNNLRTFTLFLAGTVLLGAIFLITTAQEWYRLIYEKGLSIRTNLFGTTYYSLVGLHASHVIVGLIMLTLVLLFSLAGHVTEEHSEKVETLALYWHFVDAVWVVVFLTVYVLGR